MNASLPPLTPGQRRELRAQAHALKPVVSIAQKGLTEAVLAEIDRCLTAHELIKIRTYGFEREQREALLVDICAALQAAPVQHIGKLLVAWRERPAAEAAPMPSTTRTTHTAPLRPKRAGTDAKR